MFGELFSFLTNCIYITFLLFVALVTYLYLNQNKMIYIPESKNFN